MGRCVISRSGFFPSARARRPGFLASSDLVPHEDFELGSACLLEVGHGDGVQTLGESDRTGFFGGTVRAVVADDLVATDPEVASVVGEDREGVDPVGGDAYVPAEAECVLVVRFAEVISNLGATPWAAALILSKSGARSKFPSAYSKRRPGVVCSVLTGGRGVAATNIADVGAVTARKPRKDCAVTVDVWATRTGPLATGDAAVGLVPSSV